MTFQCGLFLLQCAHREIKASVSAAVNSIYFMIQQCFYLFNVSWLSTSKLFVPFNDACDFSQRQHKNLIEMFFFLLVRTSFKKMHATVCIAIFLLAQKFIKKMYFTELYYHVF